MGIILFLFVCFCLWAISDSWKRGLHLWAVIWSALLVYGLYVWSLL